MKTSVALCTYNGELYIREQLQSIFSQTQKVDEIIICDDVSTDNTVKIVQDLQATVHIPIKIYINSQNIGSLKNFQKAINLCSNEIIFLADQDDLWEKEKVQVFVRYFMQNPDIDVISSSGNLYDGKNIVTDRTSVWDIPVFLQDIGIMRPNYFEIISSISNIATGATMALRKSFRDKIFELPVINNMHHDEWIALIAARKDRYLFITEKLTNYRVHKNQQVGINFFDISTDNLNYLLKPYKQNKTFWEYKQLLKVVINRFHRNSEILNKLRESPDAYFLFESSVENSLALYHKLRSEFTTQYPVKSFLLNLADSITKKRKL